MKTMRGKRKLFFFYFVITFTFLLLPNLFIAEENNLTSKNSVGEYPPKLKWHFTRVDHTSNPTFTTMKLQYNPTTDNYDPCQHIKTDTVVMAGEPLVGRKTGKLIPVYKPVEGPSILYQILCNLKK